MNAKSAAAAAAANNLARAVEDMGPDAQLFPNPIYAQACDACNHGYHEECTTKVCQCPCNH